MLDGQWKEIELETSETKTVTKTIEEPQFSWIDALLNKYSGRNDTSEIDLDEDFNIPTVTRTYTKEEPVTIELGSILNATQDLLWEEEFDYS